MKEIPLSRGLVALVDDADFDEVASFGKWYANPNCRTFYARKNFRRNRIYSSLLMHRLITGWDYVDHINGNGLDNRRANLGLANDALNAMNRRIRSNNTSGFKGVSLCGRRWKAQITAGGVHVHIGSFATPEEAARAYDAAALIHHGAFAHLNFPSAA